MKIKGMLALILAVTVLAGLYLISSTDLLLKERETQVYNISVVVPDENDDCWGNFKKGMDKAAIEFNADLSFVTLYQRGQAGQQSELMLREIENGAQALVVCPADSAAIAENLEKSNITAPVIALHSNINSPQTKAYIGANRYDMGENLADAIILDSHDVSITEVIAVSVPGGRGDAGETYEGLNAALSGSGFKIRREYALYDDDVTRILSAFRPDLGQVIVALDTLTMQIFTSQVRLLEESRQALYGVGCTNNILRGLEESAIRAVCVANDYDAGYLTVKTAVELLDRSKSAGTGRFVSSSLIRPQNMYDKENQMLLFPIS